MERFEDIKVGDKLILHRLWNDPKVVTVEKVTKATFTVDGIVMNKSDGYQRGAGLDSYSKWWVSKATEEEMLKVERDNKIKRLIDYLRSFDYTKLPLEKLVQLYQITKN